MSNPLFVIPALSFSVTLVVLHLMLKSGFARIVMDHPNDRSLHSAPIPRTGGLGLMAGIVAGFVPVLERALWPILLLGGALFAVSLLDDKVGLPVLLRIAAHFLAAAGMMWAYFPHDALWWAMMATLAVVWMTNLYNFMDGANGLAGGMGLFGFGFYAAAAWLSGDAVFASISLSVAAAAGAFLVFNFHPARIFMGDAGSVPLGFWAAALGILGWQRELWPGWFPVLVFSPFIVDATVILLKRMGRKQKIWLAHRQHYYQRLIRMGWSHRKLALSEYALMSVAGISGVLGLSLTEKLQYAMLAGWMAAYLMLMLAIDTRWAVFLRRSNPC